MPRSSPLRVCQRVSPAVLLCPPMAAFLGEKGSQPLCTLLASFQKHQETTGRQEFMEVFYKYCASWPDSTPTLSPTLEKV